MLFKSMNNVTRRMLTIIELYLPLLVHKKRTRFNFHKRLNCLNNSRTFTDRIITKISKPRFQIILANKNTSRLQNLTQKLISTNILKQIKLIQRTIKNQSKRLNTMKLRLFRFLIKFRHTISQTRKNQHKIIIKPHPNPYRTIRQNIIRNRRTPIRVKKIIVIIERHISSRSNNRKRIIFLVLDVNIYNPVGIISKRIFIPLLNNIRCTRNIIWPTNK